MREQYSLIGAIQAHRLARAIETQETRRRRQQALQAILARLDAARQENARDYMVERLRRETSAELS